MFVDGRNVLHEMDDIVIRRNWRDELNEDQLKHELSVQMLVARRLLTVTINPPAQGRRRVTFPRGYIVRKPI